METYTEYCTEVVAALIVQPVNLAVLDLTELWVKKGWNHDLDIMCTNRLVHEFTKVAHLF